MPKRYDDREFKRSLDEVIEIAADNIRAYHNAKVKLSPRAARQWLRMEKERANLADLQEDEDEADET